MPRRKHLPLPILLALSVACAIMAGTLIQVRRPDIGQQAVQAQIEARTPRERCDRLGDEWTFVTRTNPDVSLCYRTAWGFPQFASHTAVSASPDAFTVSFSQPVGSPVLYFHAPAVSLIGESGSESLSWDVLNSEASQANLQALLSAQFAERVVVDTRPYIKRVFSRDGVGLGVQYIVPIHDWRMTTNDLDPDFGYDVETMLRASL